MSEPHLSREDQDRLKALMKAANRATRETIATRKREIAAFQELVGFLDSRGISKDLRVASMLERMEPGEEEGCIRPSAELD